MQRNGGKSDHGEWKEAGKVQVRRRRRDGRCGGDEAREVSKD